MTDYQRTTTRETRVPASVDAYGAPAPAVSTVRTTDSEYVAPGPGGATLASRIVTFVFGILQVFLILRIILLLLVANQGNDIVHFVFSVTQPFVEPFIGMFSLNRVTADQGSVLDVAAIVALIAWTLIEMVILAGITDLLAPVDRDRLISRSTTRAHLRVRPRSLSGRCESGGRRRAVRPSGRSRRGRRLMNRPGPLVPRERAVPDDDRAARQDDVTGALDGPALVARVVDVHVVGRRRDRPLAGRVVDDEVGVRADRDRALAAGTSRTSCAGAVEMISTQRSRRDPAADDAAVVEQVDPVLDAGQAVGDLAEVAPAELLLAVEVERAVVGRDELEVVLDQPGPQLVPVVLRSQGRRADELRAIEAVAEVVERQEEVLRARLGEGLRAAVARVADLSSASRAERWTM